MKNYTHPRLGLVDLAKGIAVVLMIQVHLTELFALPLLRESTPGKLSLFLGGVPAAPVFMAIMGYFIARSTKPLRSVVRGLLIIGLGFALNLGMNAHLLLNIHDHSVMLDPLPYVFGVDILFLAGLSMVLISLFRRITGESIWFWGFLLVVASVVNLWLPEYSGEKAALYYFQAFFWGNFSWSYFPLFPWLVYPLAGFLFRLIEKTHANVLQKMIESLYLIVILTVGFMIGLVYGFRISTDLQAYYHHNPLFGLWALDFLALWMLLMSKVYAWVRDAKVTAFLEWTGRNVTAFYVVQWLLIGNIATALYQSQSALALLLWFVFVLLVSALAVYGYALVRNKLRLFKKTKAKPAA